MTDHELDIALRALTEVGAEPALAGRVRSRLERPAHAVAPPWLAAAAATFVATVAGLSWYAARPLVVSPVGGSVRLAQAAPLGVPHLPDLASIPERSAPHVLRASFSRRTGSRAEGPGTARIPAIGPMPALAISPIGDAPLRRTRLDIAPLEIVEIVIPSLDQH